MFDHHRSLMQPPRSRLAPLALLVFGLAAPASGQEQWSQLAAAAKKEGRLVLFGPAVPDVRVQVPAAFKERFGVTVEYIAGSGREGMARLRAEQQGGLYHFDAVIMGGTTLDRIQRAEMLDPLRPLLIHPDAGEGSKWKTGGIFFLDAPKQYVMRLSMYTNPTRFINSEHVKPEDATWERLLSPKWKGKIAAHDPGPSGSGQGHAAYILHQLGEEYFTKLYLGQQIVLTQEQRQLADWLARGTYPIAIALSTSHFARLKKDGFPVMVLPGTKEVPGFSTAGFGYAGLPKKAPHPNAAKLFINWLITKDGQEVYNRALGVPGMRTDLDESWTIREYILQLGFNYLDSDSTDYVENVEPKLIKRVKELLSK